MGKSPSDQGPVYYAAIVDGEGDVWGARIPDFPGCFGGGATPEEAVADVTSALTEMAERLVAKGKPLPKPRAITELPCDNLISVHLWESP